MKREVTLPMARVPESTQRIVIRAAKDLIAKVGRLPSSVERMELAIHYRRSLTDEEMALLSPQWCALVPHDRGGHGEILEIDT